jgi:surfactin synthase thioesterase subunit
VSEDPVELDRAMFSAHVYQKEPPLDVPITVLRGDEEIRVEEWREETTASFHWAAVPGDHFWLKEQPNAFIEALRGLNGIP